MGKKPAKKEPIKKIDTDDDNVDFDKNWDAEQFDDDHEEFKISAFQVLSKPLFLMVDFVRFLIWQKPKTINVTNILTTMLKINNRILSSLT